jgi:type IV secretion system protein VirB8
MKADAELAAYFAEANSWDADRARVARRSARLAWVIAGAGWVALLMAAGALLLLMPLKHVEPFVIRVDSTNGVVDVVPAFQGHAELSEVLTRYLLTHYVTVCERFNFSTAESDYEECGAFHTAQRNAAWYALWNQNNPSSPLNLYKDGSSVRAQVKSLSFFKRGNGIGDLAQVRYLKAKRSAGGTDEQVTNWIVTIQYAYADPPSDAKVRRWNPLGFKIVDFRPEPEVLPEATPPSTSLAATGPQSAAAVGGTR